jgi:urease accessory protein
MLVVSGLHGDAAEARYEGRRRDPILVTHGDAAKRRLRVSSAAGVDVAIDLPRGTYLREGAVLDDDGERILVVERVPEEALVVRFSAALTRAELAEAAARIGHVFGNQHVPVDVEDGALLIPITTSGELAAATVRELQLPGVEVAIAHVKLGRHGPLAHGPAHAD